VTKCGATRTMPAAPRSAAIDTDVADISNERY
jgi:hypothetical protein